MKLFIISLQSWDYIEFNILDSPTNIYLTAFVNSWTVTIYVVLWELFFWDSIICQQIHFVSILFYCYTINYDSSRFFASLFLAQCFFHNCRKHFFSMLQSLRKIFRDRSIKYLTCAFSFISIYVRYFNQYWG